ncbi:helicase associated domain-containing protein [Streptomyces rimosus]|uniref:helicase associated domain-containing protein n=1 Tax=Streptomyces rimosus TaxID=1927 RepID=UPI000A9B5D39
MDRPPSRPLPGPGGGPTTTAGGPATDTPLALLLQQPRHRRGKAFRRSLRAARHYRQQHGHLCFPAPHIEEFRGERVHLGAWITRLSTRLPSLTQEEINVIEHLGVEWDPALRRTAGRKQSQSPNGWSLQTSRLNWPLNHV